jgi:site-specific DNA-cytosine methylase
MTEITVGSLFSGIGGIDLGLERVGMTVKWQSEIEPYSCQVLAKHWPHVPNLGNIREVNWEEVEKVDVIAGGYPCQPFSTAGKRGGSDDPRHLWPEYLRAISVLRPRVAFLENVRGHYSLGFDSVLGDLAVIGYDCEWEIVSAQSVGAPHRRERLICLAYPNDSGDRTSRSDADRDRSQDVAGWSDKSQFEPCRCGENVANSDSERFKAVVRGTHDIQQSDQGSHVANTEGGDGRATESHCLCATIDQPAESREQDRSSGWPSDWWKVEPDVGRVAHGIPNRVDRLRGLGNAVVPQVAEVVGRVIIEMLTPI